ncbi:MAG: sulfite exporter TauE/SafE family protein [Pseudomonadota bacterium]|nr:sulfite exporter TauE/SafE family protein [Pseudomonadota bacterium]
MSLGPTSYALSLLAGLLSVLSPCVLPLVPVVVGTAVAAHPLGALVLAFGLALSFTGVGLFVATSGFAMGLDAEWFRHLASLLLIGFGVILLNTWLQQRFAAATASFGTLGDHWLRRLRIEGLRGQMIVGLLLGLVWAPCVGPTLGAATLLASQGQSLPQVALVMVLFGIGAALPLAVIGSVSRRVFAGVRPNLLRVGAYGKCALGAMMILFGVMMLAGWDRALENTLTQISPAWLTELTTRF